MSNYLFGKERWLDPPDEPKDPDGYKCAGCGEVHPIDDMTMIEFRQYCQACVTWMIAEKEAEANDEA